MPSRRAEEPAVSAPAAVEPQNIERGTVLHLSAYVMRVGGAYADIQVAGELVRVSLSRLSKEIA